jgi:hypothetical protein
MRNKSFVLSTIIAFILVLFLVSHYLIPKQGSIAHVENFTPGIRKLVRPHLRNARVNSEQYTEYFTNKTNDALKMVGLQFV